MELLNRLDQPSREYTPIPFWFLNGDLTHREIRRQLLDFCHHGVYGVVLHPRIGLSKRIGYLSPLFFRYLRTAIETAAELDMKIVLYDEGMYPSGSACGQVVQGHPEWASRGIALVEEPQPDDQVLCQTERGYLVERFSGGTIRGIHFGEDDGEPNAPPSADILNPDAVQRFLDLTHEAYYREFSAYFGGTILGFFTDEPSILGRNAEHMQPWTMGFAALFRQAGGNLAGLTGLFTGEENEDTALYRRLILQREGEVYYAALSSWCEQHGIALMGHPHQSDDIEVEKYFHVPGQDLVFRWVAPEKGGIVGMDSVMAKCSADMAYLMGRKRNSNECFGACNREGNPWHFTGADMKWYIDWLAVRGVNLFIPHAFYYSLAGKRSAERPPDVGPGNIWWPHYRQWADYMARLSCLMAEGEVQCSIAVLCRNRALAPEKAAPLFQTQRGFRYIPESLWSACRVENGCLQYGDRQYRAVIGDDGIFPEVSHDAMAVPADCLCQPPQSELRVAHLIWQGLECWLCVNEGSQTIETEALFPVRAAVGRYDLWTGQRWRESSRQTDAGTTISLTLRPRESVLLFACGSDAEGRPLPAQPRPCRVINETHFTLCQHDEARHVKTYEATVEACAGDLLVDVNAEDMAELYADGQFCGAAFWPHQPIRVPAELLKKGFVTLRLTVTGCKANQYGIQPVFYGLINT